MNDKDKKTRFIDILMPKGQSEGALVIVVILFLVLLFLSQTKTKTDILAVSFASNSITNATFYSGEVSYSNKFFGSYPTGSYSIIAYPVNTTQSYIGYSTGFKDNGDGTITLNTFRYVLEGNEIYKIENVAEGTVVFYVDKSGYDCMLVILNRQAYGIPVDEKKVCKNV